MIGGTGQQIIGNIASQSTMSSAIMNNTIAQSTVIADDALSFLSPVIATGVVVTVLANYTWRIQGFLPTTFYE